MTGSIYNAPEAYRWMVQNERELLFSSTDCAYETREAIKADYYENLHWIEENANHLTKGNAICYVAWDWSMTVMAIKAILWTV